MKREMLRQAKQYGEMDSDVYCGQIVDVIKCAAANCLWINLAAFQNIGGKAVIVNTLCAKKPSDVTVFLKYDHDILNVIKMSTTINSHHHHLQNQWDLQTPST